MLNLYRSWVLIIGVFGLIILCWFVADAVALRYLVSSPNNGLDVKMTAIQVLFIGVMSCMYVLWDVVGVYSYLSYLESSSHMP